MSIEVNSVVELKSAIDSGESEIITYDDELVLKLKAIKFAKTWGPSAIAGIIAAIPIIATTGPAGAGFLALSAPHASVTITSIVALIVAIGGTIAISLFTDWEYVELPFGIKMSRKRAK